MNDCPDEPDQTCPLIDDVLSNIKLADDAYSALNDINFKDLEKTMEEIRNANSDLRERAQFFEQQAGAFEEERDKAVTESDRMAIQVIELTKRIAELEAPVLS